MLNKTKVSTKEYFIFNSAEVTSKVLLFGEYSVLFNSQALTIPYSCYSGQLKFSEKNNLHGYLADFLTYLKKNDSPMNLIQLEKDLDLGLFFDSDIPIGQGLGSSAALTAGIFKAYCPESIVMSLNELKYELGKIESYFHGKSSGIDPLVCFVGEPILLKNKKELQIIPSNLSQDSMRLFLVPSKESRKGKDVINIILNKLKQPKFIRKFSNDYVSINDLCVNQFLSKSSKIKSSILELSHLQFDLFDEIISKDIKKIWSEGLRTNQFAMKLCGAGGGGMYLAFSFDDHFVSPLSWQELNL
jgi:mevalonate kinase